MKYKFIREALSLFNMTDPNTRCNIAGNMTTGFVDGSHTIEKRQLRFVQYCGTQTDYEFVAFRAVMVVTR